MIQLYRKGTSHIVRGITCEMQTVSEFSYEALLKSGWHLSPEEAAKEDVIDKTPKETEKTEVPKETEEAKEAREAKAAAKVEAIKAKVAAKDAEKPK